jgi:hypothetical protein
MRTGTGLALICVGAILAFAVRANPSFFNWNIAGWVIMVVGVLGLAIPRRGYAWVSRRLSVKQSRARRPGGGTEDQVIYPSGVGRNPANSRVPAALPSPGAVGSPEASTHVDGARDMSTSPADMRPGETHVVEDVYEE